MQVACPTCGTPSENAQKFCAQCGTRLAQLCSACGTSNTPNSRFCNECGAPLEAVRAGSASSSGEASVATLPAPITETLATTPMGATGTVAERRLVSVVFVDLVGFTGLAEDRDPEAVRDLLTRYFDHARETIERYGGTVEKFIGDAVMAVWGAPVAREDDPERAVRAALELVDVVRGLGQGPDGGAILARAGVLTGEAAVTLGATGQGMVAGDLVNTASRLQSVAPPGAVLVGEATYAATTGGIAYELVGDQLLKGKAAPVPAWRALRVVAMRGGVARAEGLEPPYVGRDEQLRLLKEFLHSTARERRLRFVSVTGQAGTGKSRLTWELHKYVDGLVEDVFWHQGRSPAYGEGVTFWALGEMVRKRAGLAEDDDPEITRSKIASALVEYVPDEAERRWIEPALLGLLGLEEVRAVEREELFAAWRTFFERVSDRGVTVLVFEDVHWADQGLLDFIDHVAEWSTEHPILIVTLARVDFLETHREWGAGRRNFVAMALDPLSDEAMGDLMAGLVPGLPTAAADAILARAEGIPLYAVEMVRKLLLDGRLERIGNAYQPVGDLTRVEIPDTLHALIAARLDAFDPPARMLLQDAAILGQTFTVSALAAVSGSPAGAIEGLLHELVRREALTQNRDPRSPERGQYGFVQALIREVAYGTLSRRDRRSRHLAAARHFEALGDDELAGVLATHYLDAYRLSDSGPEADAIGAQARIALQAAAERAIALHSPDQALSYADAALEVTRDPTQRGVLHELAGMAARAAARSDLATEHFRAALDELTVAGDRRGIARATAALAMVHVFDGRARDGIGLLEPAVAALGELSDVSEGIALVAALARSYLFADDFDRAIEFSDRALVAAERIDDGALITEALLTKGTTLSFTSRRREALVLLNGALQLAEANGYVVSQLRARLNISYLQLHDDPRESFTSARAGIEQARRLGFRNWTLLISGNASSAAFALGDWDYPTRSAAELAPAEATLVGTDALEMFGVALVIRALRGEEDAVVEGVGRFDGLLGDATATQEQTTHATVHAWLDLAAGRMADALAHDIAGTDPATSLLFYVPALHAALWLRDVKSCRSLAERITATGLHGRWVAALRQAAAAGIAALEGRADDAESGWTQSLSAFREIGAIRDAALVEMDRAALAAPDSAREAELSARELLNGLGARLALQRLDEIRLGRADSGRTSAERISSEAIKAES